MPRPAHHLALTGYNGKVYIFGGFEPPPGTTPGWVPLNNAWEYNPADDSWKALAPMPIARGAAQAAEINGKIYVVGGATLAPGAEKNYLDFKTPSELAEYRAGVRSGDQHLENENAYAHAA